MQKVAYTKPFLSYQAQISLLKSSGMTFVDETKALHLLKHIGYYRLSVGDVGALECHGRGDGSVVLRYDGDGDGRGKHTAYGHVVDVDRRGGLQEGDGVCACVGYR